MKASDVYGNRRQAVQTSNGADEKRVYIESLRRRLAEIEWDDDAPDRVMKIQYLDAVINELEAGSYTVEDAREALEAGAEMHFNEKSKPPPSGQRMPFPRHVWGDGFAQLVESIAKARNTYPDAAHFVALMARGACWGPAMDYEFIEGWRKQCGIYASNFTETGRGKSRLFDALMRPVYDLEEVVQKNALPDVSSARDRAEILQAKKSAIVSALKSAAKPGKAKPDELEALEADLTTINEEIEQTESEQTMPSVWFSSVTNEFAALVTAASGGMIAIVSAETPMLRIAAGGYTSGQAAVEVLNSGFDGEYVGDGRMTRDQVKVRPRMACAWGSQPDKLREYAQQCPELVYSGFLARVLLYVPPDIAGSRCRKLKSIGDQRFHQYAEATVETALRLRDSRPVFRLSAEAIPIYEAWAEQWEAEYAAVGKLALLYGFAERIHDYAGRIAALLHVHHYGPLEATISAETLRWALEVVDWCIEQNRFAYREIGIGREGELADAIWGWLCKKGLEETDLPHVQRNGPGQRKYSAAQHRIALSILAEEGKIELTEIDTGRPGRTKVEIRISAGTYG